MKISVMLFPFQAPLSQGDLTPAEVVDGLKAAGAGALEPMLSNLEASPALWRELLARAADAGLALSCLDIGANLATVDAAAQAQAQATIDRGLEFCREHNCPLALIAGSRPEGNLTPAEGRQVYGEGLAAAAARAGSEIKLTIEDFGMVPDFACHSCHVMEVINYAGADKIGVTYDNGNFLLADEKALDALQRTLPHSVHVHIKDFALDPGDSPSLRSLAGIGYQGCEIGAGEAQAAECITALKQAGYEGWLSVEVSITPPLAAAVQGADFIAKIWSNNC
jgi:sugar phosphate isomerase/epimerase